MRVVLKSKHPMVKGSLLVWYPGMADLQLFDDYGEPITTDDIVSFRIESSIHEHDGVPLVTIVRAVTDLDVECFEKEP